jgi:hypothetical protein
VKFSPALKFSLILLLPLTLAWKLAVALKPNDLAESTNTIVAFLAQNQFSVVTESEMLLGLTVITARSSGCRLLVTTISPLGDSTDQVKSLATDADRTFVVFRGVIYRKQPVFLTTVNYLWFTSLRRLGLVSQIPLVIAVISSCDTEGLPWDALRSI